MERKYYDLKTEFGNYKVAPVMHKYQNNNTLAIELELESGEPFSRLTVNLDGNNKLKDNEAFVDTNNCPEAMTFIRENDLGKPSGGLGFSGFCAYPRYEFNLDKLNKGEN